MKFKNHVILTVLLINMILACKVAEEKNIHQKIEEETTLLFDSIVKLRRHFHQNPELAGDEINTSKFITKHLLNLGLEVKTGIAGNGVIGILKGNENGKNIAWRADMDALPTNLTNDVLFKSKTEGVAHGCGHDIHMAIALGIAEILAKNKESLKGSVYFIFQPEEETFVGAKNMVIDTQFSKLSIDEIYGLHITALPVGQIMVKPNEIFAYQKRIEIIFNDEFSEHEAKILLDKLRTETLRKNEGLNPWDISEAFNTNVGLVNPHTVFKDYFFIEEDFAFEKNKNQFHLKANLYETNKSNLLNILPKIEQIINNSEYKDKFISASYIQQNPTVQNDENLTLNSLKLLNTIYGNEIVISGYGQIPYFNDDFIYFQQKIPGVYFLLGGSNIEKGLVAINHTTNFKVDEESIKIAVKSFSSLIFERVSSK